MKAESEVPHVKQISLDKLPPHVGFLNIFGISRVTPDFKSWSCIDAPRAKHGFMYVFCSEVLIAPKNGEVMLFHRGDLLYFPKHSEYRIEFPRNDNTCNYVLINFDIADPWGREYCLFDGITLLSSSVPPKIVSGMLSVSDLTAKSAHSALSASKKFYDILEKISNLLLSEKLEDAGAGTVLPAIYYLDRNILGEASVPQLAQMCLLSESVFRHAFREFTGMNPVQYKMHIRINKAKQLLRNVTDLPIEEIASVVGFYDNAYFHKAFVKYTGLTPKQYRDQKSEGKE